MNPTVSWIVLFLLKAPCPHSCANTQSPIATVPVTAAYADQIGKVKIDVPIAPNILTPKAVQIAVPMVETARYPRDVAVSGSKHSFGIAALISFDFGKSSALIERAFPFNPWIYEEDVLSVRNERYVYTTLYEQKWYLCFSYREDDAA